MEALGFLIRFFTFPKATQLSDILQMDNQRDRMDKTMDKIKRSTKDKIANWSHLLFARDRLQ